MYCKNYKLVVGQEFNPVADKEFLDPVAEGMSNKVWVEVVVRVKVVGNDYLVNNPHNSNSRYKIRGNDLQLIVLSPLVPRQLDQVNNDVNLLNNSKVNYHDLRLGVSMLELLHFNLVE